jgi:hypothetical protein
MVAVAGSGLASAGVGSVLEMLAAIAPSTAATAAWKAEAAQRGEQKRLLDVVFHSPLQQQIQPWLHYILIENRILAPFILLQTSIRNLASNHSRPSEEEVHRCRFLLVEIMNQFAVVVKLDLAFCKKNRGFKALIPGTRQGQRAASA